MRAQVRYAGDMRTKKIRFAIAIDGDGRWAVAGAHDMSLRDAREYARDGVGVGLVREYIAELEVPVPQPETLQAEARLTEPA